MTSFPNPTADQSIRSPVWTREPADLAAGPETLSWLTEKGLLTDRVRDACPGKFDLRIVAERHDLLSPADAAALAVIDLSAFIREIELTCDGLARVFAQTLVPAATLAAEPWLAALGNDALGPRLARLGGALRDPLEFARLLPGDRLFERALHAAPAAPAALWARRARYRLATHCLIVQEVFLPDAPA
jgi:chorismate--pyruvate lyase